ncbi:MAG: MarR family winged helix-turn-helix transcriptional regulator [Pararhodobacter sp.]
MTASTEAERLATVISALLDRFKVGPEGAAYDALSLTDTAIVARLAQAQAASHPVIQKDIAEALRLPKTTMTSAVKRLVARGLIVRGAGMDARARVLRLTDQGLALAGALREAQVAASAQMLAALPPEDSAQLLALLERILAGFARQREDSIK